MRVKYSFSSRKTKRATASPNLRKQKQKYPALVEKIINTSDIILEVLDARFPKETRNYELEEEIKNKKKKIIYVLNKSDLASKINKLNIQKLNPKIIVSCKNRRGIKELRNKIKELSKKIKPIEDQITIGIIGYPNTGKSSLINLLIGKSSAGVGSDAGFTKSIQKLRLTQGIILLDTPGVIPKKEYSSIKFDKITRHTIVGGRSYSQVKDPEIVILNLMKEFPNILEKHYKTKSKKDSEKILEELGKKWNYFKQKGKINFDKTARKILKDWQKGIIKI
jgi:ribosome biogenesis GTPase A